MNKLITKVVGVALGLGLAVGVGAGVVAGNKTITKAEAAESTVTWTASAASDLGSAFTTFTAGGTKTGNVSSGSYSWDWTRTYMSGTKDTVSYVSATGTAGSGKAIQLGQNGGVENFHIETSAIPGTIKTVSVYCASYQAKHNISISVGGVSYLSSTATPAWGSGAVAEKKNASAGSSSGKIEIDFTDGTRALYISSISVTYEENSSVSCTGIAASLTDSTKVWKKGETVTASDVTVYAEFSDGTDTTITNGSGVTITNGTLVAGNNTVTVAYSGETDTLSVFGKAPTGITVVTSSGTNIVNLNANGSSSVSDVLEFEVAYNTNPVTTDYAATLACALAGWNKTADDGAGNLTLTFESNGTYNFTLTANDDADVVENITFVVSGIPAIEYELFSGAIEEGKYVIASGTSALKAEITSKRGAYVTISPNANNKIVSPASNIIWTIASATIDGKTGYTIYNSSTGYFSSTNADGNADLLETATSKSVWAISGTETYEFVNQDPKTSTKANLRLNDGYGFACYGTSTGSALTLYKLVDTRTITASRMIEGTVSASTGDTDWTLDGFSFEVQYDNESTWYPVNAVYEVSEDVPTINSDGTLNVTVTGTYKTIVKTSGTITASLTYVNLYSIARLYDIELEAGSSYSEDVTFDGIYMGESGGGIILMNGAYGMLVYGQNGSAYTVGETYLTVTGTLKNFNYLYEINNDSSLEIEPLTDAFRKSKVETPSTYVVTGSETDNLSLANRKTSLSGVVYSINGVTTANTPIDDGENNSVYVTVGGNNILLYVKKALATEDLASVMKVGATITVEGFTTYYKNNNAPAFEVMFTNVVESDDDYHAADFARDLLKLTAGICNSDYDGITSNKSTLTGLWTTLAGSEYWLKVVANGEDDDFVDAVANSAIVVPEGQDAAETEELIAAMSDADALAAAAYRYDYCTAKYELTNFASRTLSVSFARAHSFVIPTDNSAVMTFVIIAIVLTTTTGAIFLLRKKKEER